MDRVVPYRRRGRVWRPSQSRRQRRARLRSPFLPFYLLVLLAGLAWLLVRLGGDLQAQLAARDAGEPIAVCSGFAMDTCVIDGDTIRHRGMKIRLADIDTPEIGSPRCAAELDLALMARQRLIELLNAGPYDIVYRGGRSEDVYGRLLRTIERDGSSLGDVLIAEGLARPWTGRRHGWCG